MLLKPNKDSEINFFNIKKFLPSFQREKYRETLKNADLISHHDLDKHFYPWVISRIPLFSKRSKRFPPLSFAGKYTLLELATKKSVVYECGLSLLSRKLGAVPIDLNSKLHAPKNTSIDLFIINKTLPIDIFIEIVTYKINWGGRVVISNFSPLIHSDLLEIASIHGYKIVKYCSIDIGRESFSTICVLERIEHTYTINDIESELSNYLNFNNGFYIEAGANDGVNQSNTLNLSIKRGWRGIMIEPIPALHKKCLLNRPYDISECAALVEPSKTGTNVKLSYANLMTTTKDAFNNPKDFEDHIKVGCEIQGNISSFEFEAPGLTIDEIVIRHKIDCIDFLSLDVEGYEAQALQGINFSSIKPKFILVEARFPEEVFKVLNPHYTLIKKISFHDYLFKSK